MGTPWDRAMGALWGQDHGDFWARAMGTRGDRTLGALWRCHVHGAFRAGPQGPFGGASTTGTF